MSLTKGGLTKTKTKSLTKTAGSFPANAWQYDMEYCIELPRFFESAGWRRLAEGQPIGPPPGPDETTCELRWLMEMQEDREERGWRRLAEGQPMGPPRGPDETTCELRWLMEMQEDREEHKRRKAEIKEESESYDPLPLMRPLMIPPGGGGFPATYTLIHGLLVLGKIVGVHFKNRYGRARPCQLEPRLRPLIDPPPGHPSYPSGHSLQYHLLAKALSTIVRSHEIGEQLFEIAWRVAENRERAGVHYRSDSLAGQQLAFEMFPVVEDAYRQTLLSAAREWV